MARPSFPRSLPEFTRRFNSEEACMDYIRDSRWPDGFECPKCGGEDAYLRYERRAVQCASCDTIAYLTAGTVMHRSRQPLCLWLMAAFLMVVDKRGTSAKQLQRSLGIKRHETAFQILHKLRAAMVAPGREMLRGRVEVDEVYIGGERKGGGSGTWKGAQEVVIGAVEVVGEVKPKRLRLAQIPGALKRHAMPFVRANVEPGSRVVTDGSNIYSGLDGLGVEHVVESTARGVPQEYVLRTIHLVFANLKTWLQGTFHGAVRKEHLQAYLNEFVFRFNRRGNLHAAFQTILRLGSQVPGPTYEGLYRGTWRHPNPRYKRKRRR